MNKTQRHLLRVFAGASINALQYSFQRPFLPQNTTLTRNSAVGTYFGGQGLLKTAGINVVRFTYNGSTRGLRGLLNEPAGTNNFLQSNAFTTTWSQINAAQATITAASATSPDGTNNGWKFQTTAATTGFGIFQSVTYSAAQYTFSIFAKAGTYGFLCLDFDNGANQGAVFNLSTGVVGFSDAGVTAAMTAVGNGWYRCVAMKTVSAGAGFPEFYLSGSGTANSRSWTAAGTETLFVYGAQLEQAGAASTYIATTTATVTRNADVATIFPTPGNYYIDITRESGVTNVGKTSIGTTGYAIPTNSSPLQFVQLRFA